MRITLLDPDGYGKKTKRVTQAHKLERREQRRNKRARRVWQGALA